MITSIDSKQNSIKWITNIPEEWELKKLKYFFNYKKGSMGQKLTSSFLTDNEGKFPVYSGQTENNGILGYWSEYEFDFQNEVIFCTTVGAKLMTTRLINGKFSLSQNCLILIPKIKDIDIRYLNYFILFDFSYRKELLPCIIQPSLRMEDLDQYSLLIPPLREQKIISRYLDKKTKNIDSLIEKIEKKIELLKEQKTALINQFVTKGLDQNVEKKDSGIDCIGEIPKHWKIKPIKYIGEITLGKMLTPNKKEGMIHRPYLRSLNVQENNICLDDINYMWFSEKEIDKLSLKEKDILVNEGGEVGRPCFLENDIKETGFQNSINRIRVSNDYPEYIFLVVYLCFIRGYYDSVVNRVSIPHLTKEKLENCFILTPPLEEQKEIFRKVNLQFENISKLIELNFKKISLLKEYRQSLISSVVTGQTRIKEDMI